MYREVIVYRALGSCQAHGNDATPVYAPGSWRMPWLARIREDVLRIWLEEQLTRLWNETCRTQNSQFRHFKHILNGRLGGVRWWLAQQCWTVSHGLCDGFGRLDGQQL